MIGPKFKAGDKVSVLPAGASRQVPAVVTAVYPVRPSVPSFDSNGYAYVVKGWTALLPEARLSRIPDPSAEQEYDVTVKVRVKATTPASAMHTVTQKVPASWVRSAEVVGGDITCGVVA